MDAIAERVWKTLLEGARTPKRELAARVSGLGEFTVRTYKAYEGRNPRTGEVVHVAAKALPFFAADDELREHVAGDGPPPVLEAGLEALLPTLSAAQVFLLGRVGGIRLVNKRERIGRDPQRGTPVTIPARVIVNFIGSQQLERALAGMPAAPVMSTRTVDEAFATLDKLSPVTTVERLDDAFAKLAFDYERHDLLTPDARTPDAKGATPLTKGDHWVGRWYVRGGRVHEMRDDGEHACDIAVWAHDMLTGAVFREAARQGAEDEVLGVADAMRVLARLSPDGPVSLRDVPF